MEPIYYTKFRRKSRTKFSVGLILFDFLLIAIFLFTKIQTKPTTEYVLGKEGVLANEDIIPYPTLPPSSPTPSIVLQSAPLEQAVQAALVGTHGSYGIVIKNLKTQENYLFNEHLSYYSASLYKLWIMAETYRQIRDGMLKEDEILSEEYKTLNAKFNVNPESAKFKEGKITLSVGDALNKMITISDNYAAFLLSLRVRLTNVASFLKLNGFDESTVGINGSAPATTAHDIALFFEKLYNKQLVNEEYSDKMLALLKAQKLNDKIPKFLPDYVITAHKTGELDGYTHDGGIVYAGDNEYIIVVLSKSDDPKLAKNRISNVSESVYNYFTNIQP